MCTRRIDPGRSETTDLTEIAVAVRSGSHPGHTSSRRPAQQLWEAAVGSSCGNMAVPHPLAEHLHGGRSALMRGGRRATPASARRSLRADVTPAQGSAVRSSPAQNTFQRHTRIRGSIRRRLNLRRSPHPRTADACNVAGGRAQPAAESLSQEHSTQRAARGAAVDRTSRSCAGTVRGLLSGGQMFPEVRDEAAGRVGAVDGGFVPASATGGHFDVRALEAAQVRHGDRRSHRDVHPGRNFNNARAEAAARGRLHARRV